MSINTKMSKGKATQPEEQQMTPEQLDPLHIAKSDCFAIASKAQLDKEIIDKLDALRCALEQDIVACDAKLTMFIAAALSYRYDTLLNPLPPRFMSEMGCRIEDLVLVVNDTPNLRLVLNNITNGNYEWLKPHVIELLHWVFVELNEPMLRTIDDEEFMTLMGATNQMNKLLLPTYAFEVYNRFPSSSEESFSNRPEDSTKISFFTTRLDNFYAIVYNGLNPPHCEMPIALNGDMEACLKTSEFCPGWGASICGSMISCMAMCEVLKDPEGIYLVEQDTGSAEQSEVVALDSSSLRLRYLFFFGKRVPNERKKRGKNLTWFHNHKFLFSLAGYLILLGTIGMANTRGGSYVKSVIKAKSLLLLEFCRRLYLD